MGLDSYFLCVFFMVKVETIVWFMSNFGSNKSIKAPKKNDDSFLYILIIWFDTLPDYGIL